MIRVLLSGFLLLLATTAGASDCLSEQEPNDGARAAQGAPVVVRGAGCLTGELEGSDADFTPWVIEGPDAARRFTLALDGAVGSLVAAEVVQVILDSKGRPRKVHRIHRVEAGPSTGKGRGTPLWLSPGEYQLVVTGSGAELEYRLEVVAEEAPSRKEKETNDKPEQASPLPLAGILGGELTKGDVDHLVWTLPTAANGRRYAARLHFPWTPKPASRRFDLLDSKNRPWVQGAPEGGTLVFEPLGLAPGRHRLRVKGPYVGPYRIETVDLGPRPEGGELEPNNGEADACPGTVYQEHQGELAKNDRDWWTFEVPPLKARRRWRLRAENLRGKSIRADLYRVHEGKTTFVTGRNLPVVDVPSLVLEPGRYRLLVTQRNPGPYTWSLKRSRARARRHSEVEPNDSWKSAFPLSQARVARGELTGKEIDAFHFDVGEPVQRWTIQVNGDRVERFRLLGPGGKVRKAVAGASSRGLRLENLLLLPGRHWVQVEGKDAPWSVRVLPTGPVPAGHESEPNDVLDDAEELRLGTTRKGAVSSKSDRDLYRLSVDNGTGVQLTLTPPPGAELRAEVHWGLASSSKRLWAESSGAKPAVLRRFLYPGEYLVKVLARRPSLLEYTLKLEEAPEVPPPPPGDPGAPPPPPPPPSPVKLSLKSTSPSPLAYARASQTLKVEGRVENPGSKALKLEFEVASSHPLWELRKPAPLTVAGGGSARLDLNVDVQPGAWANWPVTLRLSATDSWGRRAATTLELETQEDGDAVAPRAHHGLPEQLRGGRNVAAALSGARIRGGSKRWQRQAGTLLDGRVGLGIGESLDEWKKQELIVDLAPGEHTIAGFLFHPLAACSPAGRPRQVAVDLSADGTSFQEVWTGFLTSAPREQPVVLPEAMPAKAARLRILATGEAARPCLGEWAVVARPGTTRKGVNLGDPARGGHVVWSDPPVPGNWGQNLLVGGKVRHSSSRSGKSHPTVVIGFWNQRAARIQRIEWEQHPATKKGRADHPPESVLISVSTDSPLGPWKEIGEWDVREARGSVPALELSPPVWARYLRLSLPGWQQKYYRVPRQLRVIEADDDESYRSILGEWGYSLRSGPFEDAGQAIAPELALAPEGSTRIMPGHGTRETAQLLAATRKPRFHGKVRVGRREDWVRIAVPEGKDEFRLEMRTAEAVLPRIRLFDAAGKALEPDEFEDDALSRNTRARWKVSGPHVDLHLEEPKRNVIIAWDSSGSVGPYRQAIWRSVLRFSAGLDPNEEVAALLPFGSRSLLGKEWAETPEQLRKILGSYDHRYSSSDAEGAMHLATKALGEREGRRVIMVVTDAACSYKPKLWDGLRNVQPQVFSLWVSAFGMSGKSAPYQERSLMQSWSSVNRGRFSFLRSHSGVERELDRAAFEIRRPVAYLVEGQFRKTAPPKPGSLEVVRPENEKKTTRPALSIVFDASGSMYKPLGGQSRIQVARDALTRLVKEDLPAGIDVALRAFGHREEKSCRTDLELPLAPLDREKLIQKVQAIDPRAYSKTPLGASLQAVTNDLAKATGPRMVVLLTDGEETCDGDPKAAIARLRKAGVHTRVNIVGFAIDSAATKKTFEAWAKLGGGAYFDAADAAGLGEAITRAVRLPFRVLDAGGKEIAKGEVGGPEVELMPGTYVLETLGESVFRRKVEIQEGARTRVEL